MTPFVTAFPVDELTIIAAAIRRPGDARPVVVCHCVLMTLDFALAQVKPEDAPAVTEALDESAAATLIEGVLADGGPARVSALPWRSMIPLLLKLLELYATRRLLGVQEERRAAAAPAEEDA